MVLSYPSALLVVWWAVVTSGEKCRECSFLGDVAEYYCPRDGYPETFIHCCGPGRSAHCCPTPDPDYAEYAANLTFDDCNQLPHILLFLGIVIASILCCCCAPILCCCYCMPCCPWYRCRKVNQAQQAQKQEEEVPMKEPMYPIPPPAAYPQPAYPVQHPFNPQQPTGYANPQPGFPTDPVLPSAPPQQLAYNPSY